MNVGIVGVKMVEADQIIVIELVLNFDLVFELVEMLLSVRFYNCLLGVKAFRLLLLS